MIKVLGVARTIVSFGGAGYCYGMSEKPSRTTIIARRIAADRSAGPGALAGVLCLISLALIASARADLPAFPGAEGFGAKSIGGRGGRVIRVTNLNGSGPGSLEHACQAEGPRIVVFAVAGVIRGDVAIAHSRITIAGQTAPAPGITIAGRLLARPAVAPVLHDIIVQHLRIRPPPMPGYDGDVVQLPHVTRVMLDHLSLAWGTDEMIDVSHASDLTLQWSTVEESDPLGHGKKVPHNFAFFSAYAGSGNISVHRNLFAHHARRLPTLAPAERERPADFRNNVVYNFRDGLSHEGHAPRSAINLVGNYYKRGPDADKILLFTFDPRGDYYIADNYVDGIGVLGDPRRTRAALPSWLRVKGDGGVREAPAPIPLITTLTPLEAYRQVLRYAGAFPRDRITLRSVREVQDGTGAWGRHGPADPSDAWLLADIKTERPTPDRDMDGMSDSWERRHGLSPVDAADAGRVMPSGYTAIEEYLHFRAVQVQMR